MPRPSTENDTAAPLPARKARASGFSAPRPPRASEVEVEEWRGVTEDLFGPTGASEEDEEQTP